MSARRSTRLNNKNSTATSEPSSINIQPISSQQKETQEDGMNIEHNDDLWDFENLSNDRFPVPFASQDAQLASQSFYTCDEPALTKPCERDVTFKFSQDSTTSVESFVKPFINTDPLLLVKTSEALGLPATPEHTNSDFSDFFDQIEAFGQCGSPMSEMEAISPPSSPVSLDGGRTRADSMVVPESAACQSDSDYSSPNSPVHSQNSGEAIIADIFPEQWKTFNPERRGEYAAALYAAFASQSQESADPSALVAPEPERRLSTSTIISNHELDLDFVCLDGTPEVESSQTMSQTAYETIDPIFVSSPESEAFSAPASPACSNYSDELYEPEQKKAPAGRGRKRKAEPDTETRNTKKRSNNAKAAAKYRQSKKEFDKKIQSELEVVEEKNKKLQRDVEEAVSRRNVLLGIFYDKQKNNPTIQWPLWVRERFP